MGENSKIEWTDHTFNPWTGCTKVSPACDHCYAEAWAKRAGHPDRWHGVRERTSAANWRQPLKWNREAEAAGVRKRVFCASLADVFDNAVPAEWRRDLFQLIGATPHLDWLLLTKRVGNAARMMQEAMNVTRVDVPRQNVWLGATICNQEEADRDIQKLLATPARVRFLSIEPMLGPIDLRQYLRPKFRPSDDPDWSDLHGPVDWVIVGGESGPKARPMHPSWARAIRDQCAAAGVPFLFKQHGEWLATTFCDDDAAMLPSRRTVYVRHDGTFHDGSGGVAFFGGDEETAWVGKKAAGRLLDGVTHDGFPAGT